MSLGVGFGCYSEHLCFTGYFPHFYVPLDLLFLFLVTQGCAAQGLLNPSKSLSELIPRAVSAVLSNMWVKFGIIRTPSYMGSLGFFKLSQNKGSFQRKGIELIGLTSCSRSHSAGFFETRLM